MKSKLTFFYLCEGTSDEALVEHLETLVSREGIPEVLGIPRSGSAPVARKISALIEEGAKFDFVVIHRDADGRDPSPRVAEVREALNDSGVSGCPIVPVQMTEAWLLADPAAIRRAVGRPSGQDSLNLPRVREIENTHDPKSRLKEAIMAATGTTGRRRRKAASQWSTVRRILLQRLDIDGPVREMGSWRQMEADLRDVVREICSKSLEEGSAVRTPL